MKAFAIACILLALRSTTGSADVIYPAALTQELGYAIGPEQPFPQPGDPLTWVGRVAGVGPVFDNLLPPGVYELTYVFDGSTCVEAGMFDDFVCMAGGPFAVFHGGTVAVYLDTTPDADFSNLATLQDGDLVLIADMYSILVAEDDPYPPCADRPDVTSYFTFVGGIWFDRVSSHGVGFEAVSHGEMLPYYVLPPELQALGFVFGADGVVDVYGPVPTKQTTWGAVKALYR